MIRSFTQPIHHLLAQISLALEQLTDEQFSRPVPVLSGATPGQHTRHLTEFYLELIDGYSAGIVNYDARKRDYRIETSRQFAIERLGWIVQNLEAADKPLEVTGRLGEHPGHVFTLASNYGRELMYNLEHTVHHMALLRIGIEAVSDILLPANFGVASSTISYRLACAQ